VTFKAWLQKQRKRNDPVGDLSRDVGADPDCRGISGLKGWVDHLQGCGACDGAIEAMKKAWQEYRQRSP